MQAKSTRKPKCMGVFTSIPLQKFMITHISLKSSDLLVYHCAYFRLPVCHSIHLPLELKVCLSRQVRPMYRIDHLVVTFLCVALHFSMIMARNGQV